MLEVNAQAQKSETLIYNFKINNKLPIYQFHLKLPTSEEDSGISIKVFGKNSYSFVQEIITDTDLSYEEFRKNKTEYFSAVDYNFDGYLDIKLVSVIASGLERYEVWLFNSKTKRFDFNKEISDLSTPIPNFQTRQIDTSDTSSAGAEHYYESYAFKHGKLYLIKSDQQTARPGKNGQIIYVTKIVRERRFGKMKIVCEASFDLESRVTLLKGVLSKCGDFVSK
ncbi:XAC2610-related protein [Anthocerotibacter panamensis]|uniref:XAC2610-related protein n=1 Tax=Anthocerotibacter panamensis TaxID=2857077 RepID=UPI001C403BBB|nr:hypothetical protein [Anthocerotibacter panamensis]